MLLVTQNETTREASLAHGVFSYVNQNILFLFQSVICLVICHLQQTAS